MFRLARPVSITALALLMLHAVAYGELYEQVREAIDVNATKLDYTGMSVRGGLHLRTGQAPQSQPLFRAQASAGRMCGAFDFKASFVDAIQEIPDLLEALVMSVGMQLPMLAFCYLEPTWCDTVKHWQALLNFLIQAKYAQCQAIQNAMAYTGQRLAGGEQSKCLEEHVENGSSVQAALRECSSGITSLRRPDGSRGEEVRLVEDTLRVAGASEETVTVANTLFGEVTLRAGNGRLNSQSHQPQAAVLARYESYRASSEQALRTAVQEFKDTGELSTATARSIAVPGQPMPQAVIEALAAKKDPEALNVSVGQIATKQALVALTWECHEIEEKLRTAADDNTELGDAERAALEKRVQNVRLQIARMAEKVTASESLQPVYEDLLREHTNMINTAAEHGIYAPTVLPPTMPYNRQTPIGYSR